ncbi:MAG TPA: hypothetical protein ENK45_02515 [Aliiroseovarius sp.]|nr:hypothetical protein [Aliiroseovarius sp.]
MSHRLKYSADKLLHARARRRWEALARQAGEMDLESLKGYRSQARRLKDRLNRFLAIADDRLALPHVGSNAFQRPLHSDWAWRPELWRLKVEPPGVASAPNKTRIGDEATLFHDCRISEITLRQLRNARESDVAPFGLRMDVFRFDGSFLSLAIDLPQAAVTGLKRRHLIRLNTVVEMEKPLEIFARLNIRHGPNTEQIVRELPLGEDDVLVDFDLAYTKMNEKRVEAAWLDLIFEGPQMNQVILRDVNFSRRPRAEI